MGTTSLPRASLAIRADLLGALELYSIALYVDGPLESQRLASPDTPKALRIDVKYEYDLHRPLRVNWERELVPRLEAAATRHLRRSFEALRRGDVVLIEYSPARGTTVRVNRISVASDAHHDLMLAFLDHWLGQRPVSEEIKRLLSGW